MGKQIKKINKNKIHFNSIRDKNYYNNRYLTSSVATIIFKDGEKEYRSECLWK
ncbi:hypothetical protein [Clostridium rectalis]|uniref:hypothetical protein n=1 Tax=Clostridium rectalis TaxID=2040295 RepID=UPI0013DE068F|nr:hypothetical protein [Clostridium rectalis]